jgi:hypothetical protein
LSPMLKDRGNTTLSKLWLAWAAWAQNVSLVDWKTGWKLLAT